METKEICDRDPVTREILEFLKKRKRERKKHRLLLLSLWSRRPCNLGFRCKQRLFVAPLISHSYRRRRRRRRGRRRDSHIISWTLVSGGRGAGVRCIRDKKELVRWLHGFRCTYSPSPSVPWVGNGGRRRRGMKRIPFGYDRTKTENVVKLRNILSTLFTSGDKDRRPCSDPARPASSRSVGATRRSFRRGETAGQKSEARTVENVRVGNNIVRSIFAAWGDGTDAGGN